MEFVGKSVRKNFKGFGFSSGTVNSFDSSSGIFEIVYEDGHSEELNFHQVASLVMADDSNPIHEPTSDPGLEVVRQKPKVGRPRKRRRVVDRKVRVSPGNVDKETLATNTDVNLNRNVDLNQGFHGNLKENEGFDGNLNQALDEKGTGSRRDLNLNLNSNGDIEMKNGIDLNSSAFDLNLNDNCYSNNYLAENGNCCGERENVKKRGCIDLNLDANCDLDDSINAECETQRRECGFDLNLGVDEELSKDGIDCNYGGQVEVRDSTTCAEVVQETPKMEQNDVAEDGANKELKEDHSGVGSVEGSGFVDTKGVRADEGRGVGSEGVSRSRSSAGVIDGCQADIGSSGKQTSGRRKRRKVSNDLDASTERVLRRSARRGSAINHVSSTPPPATCAVADLSTSPSVSAVTEEKAVRSARKVSEEPSILPPKRQLPPSSQNLNLDGIAVLDIFSIYACLRSFSTLLFLSPFELEDFVAALKCQSPSSLFDCIHVSILQTLKKHLEYLSNEGSESASECLRSLNWCFLDSITWPIYMVEYLLIHGSGLNSGFDLASLKLFRSDYYKQPVSVKVEILRCLCDDMIEVEAVRSELNRRCLASETDMDFDRQNIEICKKRKIAMDVSGGSGVIEEIADDTTDWNSDDCCLCKMDGNLICCDGCPAAYHSKCVGVVNAFLPEGDWYCPECAIERHKPWVKPRKSARGAELLGIDPHGRLYYNSSGYLLVLDSGGAEYSLNYYHRDDLHAVLDVLKSSDIFYGDIIKAICKQWDVAVASNGASSNFDSLNSVCSETLKKGQIPTVSLSLPPGASAQTCAIKNENVDCGKPEEKEVAGNSGHLDVEVTESANMLDSVAGTDIPYMSSEGSAETMQMGSVIHNFQKQGSLEFSNHSEIPGKSALEDCSLISNDLDTKLKSKKKLTAQQNLCLINGKGGDSSPIQPGTGYLNHYSFAQTASLIVEELLRKPSEKTNEISQLSVEEIIAMQMKVILKKSNRFHWPDIHNLYIDSRKENCGWCFSCRYPTDDTDCLFKITSGCAKEVSKSEMVGFQSKWNKKGHVIDVICHIFSIENRLHGLLSGPWLNPQYMKIWHKTILKASDFASVKHLLLTLEANLHRLALSADWMKHVDSAVTVGSASHIVIASSRGSAKHGIARKRGRCNDGENNPTFNPAVGPSICWWRGGRVSRQLFNWKVLPRSLVSKAAKQGGGKKIPGIHYPESSDFAKRSKSVAWRAAVESSTSVEQLALQVRELVSNIRWDDIENTHALPVLDKDFKKSVRLFKKCVVRRKSIDGDGTRYLLDFGKRRSIPDIVMRYGTVVEESSSERKKYWLSESYVPLHLLKGFEEKRIARKSNKMISGKPSEISKVAKKLSRERGFSYLFSRAERSEYYQCGHCNKDVLIREAVSCQYCKGFFHKRHVRKSAGAIIAECTYTCHRCQNGKLNVNSKRGGNDMKRGKGDTKGRKTNAKGAKKLPQKGKKASTTYKLMRSKENKQSMAVRMSLRSRKDKKVAAAVPLRRSPRKIKYISVQKKKPGGCKKGKQKSKRKAPKKTKKSTSWQKKRTKVYHSYWLNGLRLSSKPDDERVMQFQRKMFFAPSEHMAVSPDQPKCLLCCEAGHASNSNYVACEICEEWFHGDAYGLNSENRSKIIGFRCHVCRNRTPPVCPNLVAMGIDESQLAEMPNSVRIESSEKVHGAVSLCLVNSKAESPSSETHQGSLANDECLHKEEQLVTSLDTNQGPILEYKLESNGTNTLDEKQSIDGQNFSNKELKPNTLTSDEKVMLQDSRINSGHDVAANVADEADCPSQDVRQDSFATELASLGHDRAQDDLVRTTSIPMSVADGTSADLHPDKLAASVELLHDGAKST